MIGDWVPKLLEAPSQSFVEPFSAPDHDHKHNALFGIDLIYDSVLRSSVAEMIRPESSEFVEERCALERVSLNTGEMSFSDYPA